MNAQRPETTESQPAPTAIRLQTVRPTATYTLMAVIGIFYVLQVLTDRLIYPDFLLAYLGKVNTYILAGQVWRFDHADTSAWFSAACNFQPVCPICLGMQLEGIYGHRRFVELFFISAFGGNVLSFVLMPAPSLGASTAIFGLLAAEIIFVLQNKSYLGGRTRSLLSNLLFICC